MTFWDHLEVLRWCIIRVIAVLLVLMIGAFVAMPYIFDDFILGARSSDFFVYRLLGGLLDKEFSVQIINYSVTGPFFVHMSTSFLLALVLAFPYLVWEVWGFIRPALLPREVKGVRGAMFGSTLLFYLGAAVGYLLVFPITFRFLALYQIGSVVNTQIALNSYIGTFMGLIFVMGLMFELPVVLCLFGRLGVIDREWLRKYRRHAIVVLLVVSAIVTPTGDPFTLMVVFLPVYALYELSVVLLPKAASREEI